MDYTRDTQGVDCQVIDLHILVDVVLNRVVIHSRMAADSSRHSIAVECHSAGLLVVAQMLQLLMMGRFLSQSLLLMDTPLLAYCSLNYTQVGWMSHQLVIRELVLDEVWAESIQLTRARYQSL